MSTISIIVRRTGGGVDFINNETHIGIGMRTWEHADYFAQALRRFARGFSSARETISPILVMRREGDNVLIECNDTVFALVPSTAAMELSNAVISKAREIESELLANDIAFDQALLLRSGAAGALGVGLTDNPDIQDMAGNEAAWNTTLRKALPGGVRQQSHIGVPKVIKSE